MNRIAVPVELISGLLDIAVAIDVSVIDVLAQSNIDPEILIMENAHLSGDDVQALTVNLYEASKDSAFGVNFGDFYLKGFEKVAGELFRATPTMREVIRLMFEFKDLLMPSMIIEFKVQDDLAVLGLRLNPDVAVKPEHYALAYELVWVPMCKLGWFMQTGEKNMQLVQFNFPRPIYADKYQEYFQCEVMFDADKTEFRWPVTQIDSLLNGALPQISSKAAKRAQDNLSAIRKGNAVVNQSTVLLCEHLADENYSIECLAKALNMTVRSLQRTLKLANTSVVKIKDKLRLELSQQLLLESSLTIEDIAYKVGFNDSKNFHRAFKRWKGISPGQYRKQTECGE